MRLYLVQHGKAVSPENDPKRPLSQEGRDDLDKVTTWLAGGPRLKVDRVIHSGKLRSQQTAQIIAYELGLDDKVAQEAGLAPADDVQPWAGKLQNTDEDLMLVGHLPHLSKLASQLLCGSEETDIIDFREAGVVCMERIDTGSWMIEWIIVPDIL